MRCLFSGLRVLLSPNAREAFGADRRADTGADKGAIVLRRCRPLYWTTVSAPKCASPPANSPGHSLRTNS